MDKVGDGAGVAKLQWSVTCQSCFFKAVVYLTGNLQDLWINSGSIRFLTNGVGGLFRIECAKFQAMQTKIRIALCNKSNQYNVRID